MNVKTLIIAVIAFAITGIAKAQTVSSADTIKVIPNASQVLVTRQGNNTKVKALIPQDDGMKAYQFSVNVEENESVDDTNDDIWENEIPFTLRIKSQSTDCGTSAKRKVATVFSFRNIYWGWNFIYDEKAGLKNSSEFGIGELIGVGYKPWRQGPELSIGAGFGRRRHNSSEGFVFTHEGDNLQVVPIDATANKVKSHVDVWSIHIPILLRQRIYKQFGVGIGGDINLNTYAKAKSSYTATDGIRYSESYTDLQQRTLTVDVVGFVGWLNAIGMYVRWTPMNEFKQPYGPEYKSWSLGVALNF
jgi:hypothetical protein